MSAAKPRRKKEHSWQHGELTQRQLAIFADGLRDLLGLEPIHLDREEPKRPNRGATNLERFDMPSYEWPRAMPPSRFR